MSQTLCTCRIWMYEVVWVGCQPQPWSCGIISTPQWELNPQIWGQHGQCNGIRVQPYAIETACQCLKHFVWLIWMYEVVGGGCKPQPWGYGSFSTPQVNLNSQNSGKLGSCNGIRVQPYALERAYQCLKHFIHVLYGCMKWFEMDVSLNHEVVASFLLFKWTWIPKSGGNLASVMV